MLTLAAVLCAAPALSAPAQRKGARPARPSTPGAPAEKEPTLEETLAWLKEKLTSSAFYKRVSSDEDGSLTTVYKVTGVGFEGCTMTMETSLAISSSFNPSIRETLHHYKVSLGDLDPARVEVYQLYKSDAAITEVQAYTAGDAPKVQDRRDAPGLRGREVEEKAGTSIAFTFAEKDLAERAGKALAHAIKLCGAKREPF